MLFGRLLKWGTGMICWTVLWHIVLHSGGFGLDLAVLLIRAVFSLEHLSQVDVMILYAFFCNSPFTLWKCGKWWNVQSGSQLRAFFLYSVGYICFLCSFSYYCHFTKAVISMAIIGWPLVHLLFSTVRQLCQRVWLWKEVTSHSKCTYPP